MISDVRFAEKSQAFTKFQEMGSSCREQDIKESSKDQVQQQASTVFALKEALLDNVYTQYASTKGCGRKEEPYNPRDGSYDAL